MQITRIIYASVHTSADEFFFCWCVFLLCSLPVHMGPHVLRAPQMAVQICARRTYTSDIHDEQYRTRRPPLGKVAHQSAHARARKTRQTWVAGWVVGVAAMLVGRFVSDPATASAASSAFYRSLNGRLHRASARVCSTVISAKLSIAARRTMIKSKSAVAATSDQTAAKLFLHSCFLLVAGLREGGRVEQAYTNICNAMRASPFRRPTSFHLKCNYFVVCFARVMCLGERIFVCVFFGSVGTHVLSEVFVHTSMRNHRHHRYNYVNKLDLIGCVCVSARVLRCLHIVHAFPPMSHMCSRLRDIISMLRLSITAADGFISHVHSRAHTIRTITVPTPSSPPPPPVRHHPTTFDNAGI